MLRQKCYLVINNLCLLSTLTVSKSGSDFTFSGEGIVSNGLAYTIATILEQLRIDQPNRENEGMIIDGVSGDNLLVFLTLSEMYCIWLGTG